MPSRLKALPPQHGLGKAIRVFREEKRLTGSTLAERSEVSASWISRIEHGHVDPTWGTIGRLAKGLGVPLKSLADVAEGFEED